MLENASVTYSAVGITGCDSDGGNEGDGKHSGDMFLDLNVQQDDFTVEVRNTADDVEHRSIHVYLHGDFCSCMHYLAKCVRDLPLIHLEVVYHSYHVRTVALV